MEDEPRAAPFTPVGRPTFTFTKAATFTEDDRKVIWALSRCIYQGVPAPPFVVRHMSMSGILISTSTHKLN